MANDWRSRLPKEDQAILDDLLAGIEKHRDIYENADNPQIAQMWLILLELAKQKQPAKDDEKLRKMQRILRPRRTEIMDTIDNY